MENIPEKINKEERPVYKIIQEIKEGRFEAKDLSKEMRQECVEVLTLEGYSVSTIAQLLDRSEKTIKRDLKEIWQRNSEKPSLELALQMIGEMIHKSKSQQSHLMRLSRSKEGSLQERVQAEYCAWKIQNETIERLQTLGYLPSRPKEIVGDIYHHQEEDIKTLAQLKEELITVERITRETGTLDEETKKDINSLRLRIEQAEITQEVKELVKNKTNEAKEIKEGD